MKTIKIANKVSMFIVGGVLLLAAMSTSFTNISYQVNSDPLSTWDKGTLKQANTAAVVSYLSGEEKKFIFYTNLCRLKPKFFCQTVLADYLKTHPVKPVQAANLQSRLNEDKSTTVLIPDEQLCNIARDFAKKLGQEGGTGHADFQNRIKPVMGRYNRVGENCDYGHTLGIDAFMNLLIDSSDPINLQHRKNLLDPKFSAIGVSVQPHKKFNYNFVIDFGGN